jgi:predicted dehydrogenase
MSELATQTVRLGFLGTGWIGRNRLEAVAASGVAEVAAVADPADGCRRSAMAAVPGAAEAANLQELLDGGIDGLVIATPSALHAEQSIAALGRGIAVFCQKPLGRTAGETAAVVEAARSADRLLGVDLSYRFTAAMLAVRDLVAGGGVGRVHAVELVFHNAYGPDKAWFHDPALSGGGCVVDLGIHLVDLMLWVLGFPEVEGVSSRRMHQGRALGPGEAVAEDFCTAQLDLAGGASARLACSWYLPAGRGAVIEATFYGSEGAASMHNVDGSFYDFRAEHWRGTSSRELSVPPDDWGGRAAVDWAGRLTAGERFDPAVQQAVQVAHVLDRIIGRSS